MDKETRQLKPTYDLGGLSEVNLESLNLVQWHQ